MCSLYANISNVDSLVAVNAVLDIRLTKGPESEHIIMLLNHMVTMNHLHFNGNDY